MIKFIAMSMMVAYFPAISLAQTAYGACPMRAQDYQERYERLGRNSDLVCMQEALERELSGQDKSEVYDCPKTSESYQNSYEIHGRTADLVCMQTALERELR